MPAGVIFLLGGLMACFAGYRLFRIVLGIYGFVIGAAITVSMMGEANTFALVVAAIVGGLVGAVLMLAAYFVGVGLIGAGLSVLALNTGWQFMRHTDPPTLVVVIVAVLGALLALSVARYVVIFGTALGGSWTALVGGLALAAHTAPAPIVSPETWTVYPDSPLLSRSLFFIVWFVLALIGAMVQLWTTTKLATKKKPKT